MSWKQSSLLFLAAIMLSACATIPTGPGIMVLPGPGKSFEEFESDDAVCREWARKQTGVDPGDTLNETLAKGAAIGTMIGAGLGAAIGAAAGEVGTGAAIGAATGLLGGTAVATEPAYAAGCKAQKQYDHAYLQCMYAKGNQIPGVSRPPRRTTREGTFALKLAQALKIGPVRSESEAQSMLASLGIAPRRGWFANRPLTPDSIQELQASVERAAVSGKIFMNQEDAIKAFCDLVWDIESQYARIEAPPVWQPYPEPCWEPEFYCHRYFLYLPYPYSYVGYYRYHYYSHRYHHPYWRHRLR